RRDRVAVGIEEAVAAIPRHGPFDRAVAGLLVALAGEAVTGDPVVAVERGLQIVLQAAGEVEHGLFGRLVPFLQQCRIAGPANLDAAEQVGLGARHAHDARRLELRALAEDIGVGMEAGPCAAAVVDLAEVFQYPLRYAARKALAPQA